MVTQNSFNCVKIVALKAIRNSQHFSSDVRLETDCLIKSIYCVVRLRRWLVISSEPFDTSCREKHKSFLVFPEKLS